MQLLDAQPCQQARVACGAGGRGRWARCIPVFFAELGVGFSDIQAFTEHCFTIAGTKRENRVTPTAPAGAREPDLHAPKLGAAHLAPGQGHWAGERRAIAYPLVTCWAGWPGQALEAAQHRPPAPEAHQPQQAAHCHSVPRVRSRAPRSSRSGGTRRKGRPGTIRPVHTDPIPAPAPAAARSGKHSRSHSTMGSMPSSCPEAQASGVGGVRGAGTDRRPGARLGEVRPQQAGPRPAPPLAPP